MSLRCSATLLLAALAFCSSGCTALMLAGAGAAGAAGYAYINGDLEKSYPASVGQCWPAVVSAVQELGMPVIAQSVDDLGGRLQSVTADGKKVLIKLEARPTATVVKVRVGLFGDKARSIVILDKIDQKLAKVMTPGDGS